MSWCAEIFNSMEIVDIVDDIPSVESLLIAHDERKKEIEAREEMFGKVIAQGEEMIESGHHCSEEVQHHSITQLSYTTPQHTLPNHITSRDTTPHHTIQHRTTPYQATSHHAKLHHTTRHDTTPYHITSYHTTTHHTTPYYTIPYYTIPCHISPMLYISLQVYRLCFNIWQISEKVELLLTEREGLHDGWTECQTQYDQMYELAVFMKEAKQIETIMSSQEVRFYALRCVNSSLIIVNRRDSLATHWDNE